MRFTTAFIALLAITPALCAPVPTPAEPNTVEELVASAKGNPVSLVEKMGPIVQEITTLINAMAHPSGADAPKAVVAPTTPKDATAKPDGAPAAPAAPTAPAENKAADPATPATPNDPAANPEPATPTTEAAAGGAPDAAGPTDAPDAGTVQRRDVDPSAAEAPAAEPEPSSSTSTAASAPAPTAPAPAPAPTPAVASASTPTAELKPNDVYKLRKLLQKATMYEQAVEQMLLAKGKNIEDRPTMKTPGGVAWGIANGPIMAVLGMSGMVQKQPS